MKSLRVLGSENFILSGEDPEFVVAAVDRPRRLRILSDDLVHLRVSDDASDPSVAATVEDFPVREFEDIFVILASNERVSVVRADGVEFAFVSCSEIVESS